MMSWPCSMTLEAPSLVEIQSCLGASNISLLWSVQTRCKKNSLN
jgi:hypothetical protein